MITADRCVAWQTFLAGDSRIIDALYDVISGDNCAHDSLTLKKIKVDLRPARSAASYVNPDKQSLYLCTRNYMVAR